MISEKAIKQYLNEPRDDWRWLKDLDHRELNKLLDELDPKPNFWPALGLHQKVALYLGILLESFAFWYDMGTGKTLTTLELLQYWWDAGLMKRALVFVTSDKAFSTWERQIKQYKITVPYCTLDAGTSKEKWRILDNFDEGIILLHYPGAVAMVSGPSKKKKSKLALVPKLIDKLLIDVDAAVYDESTKAGKDSLTHRLCRHASKAAKFRYTLAGMPHGRDPTPLWYQMYLVDHGKTLGPTLGLFREAFFTGSENPFVPERMRKFALDWKFKEKMTSRLSRMELHRSLSYTADECIDLPPDRDIPEYIKLPPDTRSYYDDLVNEIVSAKGNMRAVKNAFLRMRQLSSGFLGMKDDETGEKAQVEFEPNVKLERLLDLADTFPENRKALIFYQYTYSGRKIVESFKEEFKLDVPWLWSGTKNPSKVMADFIEGDAPFCVINNQVGAYSLDGLQVANYEFIYEAPLSAIDYEQMRRRIRRQGQKHRTTFFYNLIVRNTVDENILEFHKEGRDLFKALITNPSSVLRNKR
jgi:hypothetical protein